MAELNPDSFSGDQIARDADAVFQAEAAKVRHDLEKKLVFSLIGNVNAGKSSTINALTGLDLAAVKPIAGYTKEVALYPIPGAPNVLVADTPGLQDVNAEVSQRARDFLEKDTDVVLFFINATQGVTAPELAAYRSIRQLGMPVIVVVNRIDNLDADEVDELLQDVRDKLGAGAPIIATSAKQGTGIDELTRAIFDIVKTQGKDLLFAKVAKRKDVIVDGWVKGAAVAAFGLGVIPIPGSDSVPLTALQVALLVKIAALYDVPITRDNVVPFLTEVAAGVVGKAVYRAVLKAVGWLAGPVGEAVAAGVAGAVAASMTYGIGKTGKEYFRSGMQIEMPQLRAIYQKAAGDYKLNPPKPALT